MVYCADCYEYGGPPKRTSPPQAVTEQPVSLGQSIDVLCSGFFGDLAACDECDIGWIRHPFNLSDFEPIVRNTALRVYTDNQTT